MGERQPVPPPSAEAARETGTHEHPEQPAGLRCLPSGSGRLGTSCRSGRGASAVHIRGRHFKVPAPFRRNRCPFPTAAAVGQGRGVRPGRLPPARPGAMPCSRRGRGRVSGAARWAEAARRKRRCPPGRRLPEPGQPAAGR